MKNLFNQFLNNVAQSSKILFQSKPKPMPPIGEHFLQELHHAHSELVGDKKVFKMKSGNIYLAECVEIRNPYNHGADDTALRDLVWKILDCGIVAENLQHNTKTLFFPWVKMEYEIPLDLVMEARNEADLYEKISREFIAIHYPEQNKSFRFLRG